MYVGLFTKYPDTFKLLIMNILGYETMLNFISNMFLE